MSDTTKPDFAAATQTTIDTIDQSVKNLKTHSAASAGPGTLIHDVIRHLEDAAGDLKKALRLHQEEAAVPAPPAKPAVPPAPAGDAQKAEAKPADGATKG